MKFEVYCDESRPDLLCAAVQQVPFMVIGSLWLREADRAEFKDQIHRLRNAHKIGGEFKWQKVSPSRVAFYRELVQWFLSVDDRLRFRCIAVEPSKVRLELHDSDAELGFYKFYYQLLHHWILDFNEYSVFVDFKSNRRRDRLPTLQQCLSRANLSSAVARVQAVESSESVLMQMADVLTGLAAASMNNTAVIGAKGDLLHALESGLGRRIAATNKGEQKFNLFKIDLGGGW